MATSFLYLNSGAPATYRKHATVSDRAEYSMSVSCCHMVGRGWGGGHFALWLEARMSFDAPRILPPRPPPSTSSVSVCHLYVTTASRPGGSAGGGHKPRLPGRWHRGRRALVVVVLSGETHSLGAAPAWCSCASPVYHLCQAASNTWYSLLRKHTHTHTHCSAA